MIRKKVVKRVDCLLYILAVYAIKNHRKRKGITMNGLIEIEPAKTYANRDTLAKAIAKTGDEKYRHIIMTHTDGRVFPLFIVKADSLAETGLHFRWNVMSA